MNTNRKNQSKTEKNTGILQSEISWLDWYFPKDLRKEKVFYVINSVYLFDKQRGETRIVRFDLDSFLKLGQFKILKIYKTIEETEKGHVKYNEMYKRGKIKCIGGL